MNEYRDRRMKKQHENLEEPDGARGRSAGSLQEGSLWLIPVGWGGVS